MLCMRRMRQLEERLAALEGVPTAQPRGPLSPSDPEVYAAVSARRMQWGLLLWQTPLLAFTGQALIFNVLFNPEIQGIPRIAAGVLSMGVSFLSLTLMARNRQAEETDVQWLENYEKEWGDQAQHGRRWTDRRDRIRPGYAPNREGAAAPPQTGVDEPTQARADNPPRFGWGYVPLVRAYALWVVAFWLLFFAAAVVGFWPGLISAPPEPSLIDFPSVVVVTPAPSPSPTP